MDLDIDIDIDMGHDICEKHEDTDMIKTRKNINISYILLLFT